MTAEPRKEARWAEAQSLLDRTPTQSAERRLRRWRQLRVLHVATALLVSVAVALVFSVLFSGSPSRPAEVPTWQTVLGLVIAGAGLVLQVFGVVLLLRANRRVGAWRNPLAVLTRAQRKELIAQVRGKTPTQPARVPLARLLAEQLMNVRNLMTANSGLGIAFVGQWIAFPATWRAVIAAGFGLLLGVGWLFVERDARLSRRYLEAYSPATE